MVDCGRCHRKFDSYSGLLQHYKVKHPNATNLKDLERQVRTEQDTRELVSASLHSHGPSKTKLIAFSLIVLIAVSVTAYVAFAPKEVVTTTVSAKAAAPNFSLPEVNGGTFTLSDYMGKSNVLLFFNEGLSCAPCLQQMQGLDQLNAEFGRMNVVVVDVTADPLQLLTDWTRSSGPQYAKVLSDQNLAVSKMYGMLGPDVSMMPYSKPGHTFVLVNTSGVIVWRQDYGPSNMFVPNNQIVALVSKALGAG